jgi:quercetin dioxygenase-like cupin family protein
MKLGPDPVPVFDALLEGEFLEGLKPIEPSGARAAAMKARVLAEINAARDFGDFLTIHRSEGTWKTVAPGVSLKPLVEAPGMRAFLLRLESGASLPAHEHATPEESVVLEGEVWLGHVHCQAGDFHLAPAGRRHGAIRTSTGCLLYVRTGGGKGTALL